MKKGEKVRFTQPVLEGKVLKVVWDEDADEKSLLVEYTNAKGDLAQRWVRESQLEVITPVGEGE